VKKYMYILGSIEIVLGACMLCAASMLKEFLPVWGYIEFRKLLSGSYTASDYTVSTSYLTAICVG
jgi:hypothetical protein